MSNTNLGNPAKYSLEQNMNAYNRLPKKVRLALMYSDHNWSAGHVRYAMTSKKYKLKSDQVIEKLKAADERVKYDYLKDTA